MKPGRDHRTRERYRKLALLIGFAPQLGFVALMSIALVFPTLGDQMWRLPRKHAPVWFGVIAMCMVVAFVFWRKSRPPKRVPNCCGNCGYALALGLERCPECGEVGTRVPVPEREGLL